MLPSQVAYGFIGAYPNAFFKVHSEQVEQFVVEMSALKTKAEYFAFKSRYGVRRTDKRLWPFSDQVHRIYRNSDPIESGILDFNRLEDR